MTAPKFQKDFRAVFVAFVVFLCYYLFRNLLSGEKICILVFMLKLQIYAI